LIKIYDLSVLHTITKVNDLGNCVKNNNTGR